VLLDDRTLDAKEIWEAPYAMIVAIGMGKTLPQN
jgi:hypothetical protein